MESVEYQILCEYMEQVNDDVNDFPEEGSTRLEHDEWVEFVQNRLLDDWFRKLSYYEYERWVEDGGCCASIRHWRQMEQHDYAYVTVS